VNPLASSQHQRSRLLGDERCVEEAFAVEFSGNLEQDLVWQIEDVHRSSRVLEALEHERKCDSNPTNFVVGRLNAKELLAIKYSREWREGKPKA
jgi:hypothetical protein